MSGTAAGRDRFGAMLARAMAQQGPCCVGIDPHPGLLAAWGLDDDGPGLERFGRTVVEAAASVAAAVKPQSALFERRGVRGIAALAAVLRDTRQAGILSILDAKRGDIGSTMAAYAEAYLADGAELAADAITLSPYLGFESLAPTLDLAEETGRGAFVLALTSNPSGPGVQHATGPDGRSVAAGVAAGANQRNRGRKPMGDIGLVVGATVADGPERAGLDLAGFTGPILAPGFGAQGAGPAEVRRVFGAALPRVLISSSRAVLQAGPGIRQLQAGIVHMKELLLA